MALELSVLIATMPSRKQKLETLLLLLRHCISFEAKETIELITDDSMTYNIGIKRNKLLSKAKGKYIVYVDDDDFLDNEYIKLIINACKSNADCIGINGIITTNGKNKRNWFISKQYKRWFERGGVYYRTPNHISPVKRELALKAGFPEIEFGEDAEYSRRLLPFLKTEFIIKKPIYWYDYNEK